MNCRTCREVDKIGRGCQLNGLKHVPSIEVMGVWSDHNGEEIKLNRCPVMDVMENDLSELLTIVQQIRNKNITLSYTDFYQINNIVSETIQFIDRIQNGERN